MLGGVPAEGPFRGRPRQFMIQSVRNREACANHELPSGTNVPAISIQAVGSWL